MIVLLGGEGGGEFSNRESLLTPEPFHPIIVPWLSTDIIRFYTLTSVTTYLYNDINHYLLQLVRYILAHYLYSPDLPSPSFSSPNTTTSGLMRVRLLLRSTVYTCPSPFSHHHSTLTSHSHSLHSLSPHLLSRQQELNKITIISSFFYFIVLPIFTFTVRQAGNNLDEMVGIPRSHVMCTITSATSKSMHSSGGVCIHWGEGAEISSLSPRKELCLCWRLQAHMNMRLDHPKGAAGALQTILQKWVSSGHSLVLK